MQHIDTIRQVMRKRLSDRLVRPVDDARLASFRDGGHAGHERRRVASAHHNERLHLAVAGLRARGLSPKGVAHRTP
jgi:hypothetical protein